MWGWRLGAKWLGCCMVVAFPGTTKWQPCKFFKQPPLQNGNLGPRLLTTIFYYLPILFHYYSSIICSISFLLSSFIIFYLASRWPALAQMAKKRLQYKMVRFHDCNKSWFLQNGWICTRWFWYLFLKPLKPQNHICTKWMCWHLPRQYKMVPCPIV